jgi:TetR/AcrR family transcriptional regulator, transcriptional repressor for nem operon
MDMAKVAQPLGRGTEEGTRARLIAEAQAMVRRRGYTGFSYADLAEAIGIRKASIHHYFPTKEDLGAALIEAYRERYDTALATIWEASESGLARVKAYTGLYRDGLSHDLGCLCGVMACERDILPGRLREAIARFFEAHLLWLERALDAGIRSGTVTPNLDPASQARLVLSSLQGALMLGHLSGEAEGFEAAVAALLKILSP